MEEDQDLDLNFSLLEGMDLSFHSKNSKKRKIEQEDYEVRIKEFGKKLPIIEKGKVIYPAIVKQVEENVEENVEVEDDTEEEVPKVVKSEPKQTKPKTTAQVKNELAEMALTIIEDPEKNISLLTKLNLKQKKPGILKLQILTQLAVFRDIIPMYRIIKYPESTEKLSKEVGRLRHFEQTLLNCYQEYLVLLESLLKGDLKAIAVKCFCSLLETHPHFNFRINVMTVVVGMLCVKDVSIASMCSESLIKLLKDDESGEYGLEVVKLISGKLQSLKHNVLPIALEPLLSLRLQYELKPADVKDKIKKKDREYLSKQQRKKRKVLKEVEKEMMEAEIVIDTAEREKLQSETLKFLFLIYFRVLKQASTSPLVPVALEGLSLYTHLINIDFFDDLLKVLKEISSELHQKYLEGQGSAITALHCVISALELVESVQGALEMDMTDFYGLLYTILGRMGARPGSVEGRKRGGVKTRGEVELVLRGVAFMLAKGRKVPMERVAAFMKRMATIALATPHNGAIAILKTIKRGLDKFPSLIAFVEEDGRLGTGVYDACRDDPQLCNPFATSMWEIPNHYHPIVKSMAGHIIGKRFEMPDVRVDMKNVLKGNQDMEKWGTSDGFELVPGIRIPAGVKKKTFRMDGPTAYSESDFATSLIQKAEKYDV